MKGVKQAGCGDRSCEACAKTEARARLSGAANVFVAVSQAELRVIKKTDGLGALATRIETARYSERCIKRRIAT